MYKNSEAKDMLLKMPIVTSQVLAKPLIEATAKCDTVDLRLLLQHDADPNLACGGRTPLTQAAWWGHAEAAQLILEYGADPDANNDMGHSALTEAANMGRAGVLNVLLHEAGAKLVSDRAGWTALTEAARCGHADAVKVLLSAGANPSESGMVPHAQSHDVRAMGTPLVAASCGGHAKVVQLLLDAGADPNEVSSFGTTPLTEVCMNCDDNSVRKYGSASKVVENLIAAGADPNLQDSSGRTPLVAAEFCGFVARALLDGGANPELPDARGMTPMRRALENRDGLVIRPLLEAGVHPGDQAAQALDALKFLELRAFAVSCNVEFPSDISKPGLVEIICSQLYS